MKHQALYIFVQLGNLMNHIRFLFSLSEKQQIKGQWKVNHEVLAKLHKEAKQLCNKCVSFEISHVLRVCLCVSLSLSL